MRSLHRSRHQQPVKHDTLPYGVRIIALARAVRWIGWGLGEALIPVFIFSFSKTFAEAGLFKATYEIVSLISLPFIGVLADKVSAKYLILISLLLYPLVGISYFFAGIFALPLFIVIARGFNGFLWEVENIGVSTYYRRTADHKHVATSFGYIDTWSNFAWIIAALIGMLLIPFIPIYYLLLCIAPAALVALVIAMRAPKDNLRTNNSEKVSFIRSYGTAVKEWRTWNLQLWILGALVFFSGIINVLMWFFIPIDAYIAGASLSLVILLTIIGALPSLFGYKLGKIADARNKHALIAFGLIWTAAIMVGLAIFPQYAFKLIASFLLGIILELFYVVESNLITTLGPSETYGQRGSAFESIVVLGDLVAPLILGIGLDVLGFSKLAWIVAVAAIVLALLYKFGMSGKRSYQTI